MLGSGYSESRDMGHTAYLCGMGVYMLLPDLRRETMITTRVLTDLSHWSRGAFQVAK